MSKLTYVHEAQWRDGLIFVISKNGKGGIARCDSRETAESICAAVNCYEELVAACEKVIENYDGDFSKLDREAFPELACEYDLARAALAKTKKSLNNQMSIAACAYNTVSKQAKKN